MAWKHIATGGKRLRARLAVQMVDASGTHADCGVAWGAACELLHNASLQEFVDAALRPVEHTRPGVTGHDWRMG